MGTPFAAADDRELLNEEERQWLESLDEPLIVGSEANYRPYSYVDEEGQLAGIAGDYLQLLGETLRVDFVVVEYESFAAMLEAAEKRHIDIVPFVIAAPERRSYLDFTQSFFNTRDRILTRVELQGELRINDLPGMRVGIVDGYALQKEIEEDWPEIILMPVRNELIGLRELSLGVIDALIVDVGVASYFIQQESITNLRVSGEIGDLGAQAFGTRSDWPILNGILGKGLADISAEQHNEIQRRWINIGGVDPGELDRLWQQARAFIGVVSLFLIVMIIWTLSLRRLVARRTLQLRHELEERRRVEGVIERLAIAVEHSAGFVLVLDVGNKIEYANLSFLEAYGCEDIRGLTIASLCAHGARDAIEQALDRVREDGVWRGKVDMVRKDNVALEVEMTIAPIFNEHAEIDGYVATGRDVTKEEQLEARHRRGERLAALGTLAGGIAHDFNNLLVPILGYTDLIRLDSSPKVTAYLDAISEAGERARDLVKRILNFGSVGAGVRVPLDMAFEVGDAVTFLTSLLPSTINVKAEIGKCPAVLGDRAQIQQVLLNLCSNAGDAMAVSGGTLEITLERHTVTNAENAPLPEMPMGDYARLTVGDTGVGMDGETKARIFEPYFTDKVQAKGTGLGLATVHGIVSGYGGFIHVDSVPGTGSTFQIYFPSVDQDPARPGSLAEADEPRGHGERVMVIDDDELVLGTVKAMVESLGYEVSAWSDSVAALSKFNDAPDHFSAIVADFTMPELTGLQVVERARDRRPELPAIIITGNPGALQDNGIACVGKPLALRELANQMRDLLAPASRYGTTSKS